MSEVMASLVSSGAPQQAQQKSQLTPAQNSLDEATTGSEFSSAFHELMNDAMDKPNADASATLPDMAASAMLPLQPFTVNGVS